MIMESALTDIKYNAEEQEQAQRYMTVSTYECITPTTAPSKIIPTLAYRLNKKMRRYIKMIKSQQRQSTAPQSKAKSLRINIVDWDAPALVMIPAIRALQE